MPQPKSSRPSSRSTSSTSRKSSAASSGRGSAASKSKRSTAAKQSSARKAPSARNGAGTAKRTPTAGRGRTTQASAAPQAQAAQSSLSSVRDRLSRGVVVTAETIQEAMDDAVERGRVTRDDAQSLAEDIVNRGRKQAQDFLADVDQLLGRGRSGVGTAAGDARRRATKTGDRVLREVDRARRAARIGSFPILAYDDLTAQQVTGRLADLTPAELRKVRDYEKRHGNRKSVLGAIEKQLA